MSKRAWIAGIALGLVSVVTSLAQEPPSPILEGDPIAQGGQEQRTTDSKAIPEGKQNPVIDITPALNAIESAIRDLIAEEDEIERSRQIENDTRDLDAQEAMAKWAYWMFWATFGTVLLTAAALIAIIRTLHHTRRAADYTQGMLTQAKLTTEAANATAGYARQANDISEESKKDTLRAYVYAKRADIYWKVSENPITPGMPLTPAFRVYLCNDGETPATRVRFGGEVQAVLTGRARGKHPKMSVFKRVGYIGKGVSDKANTIHALGNIKREADIKRLTYLVLEKPKSYTLFLRGTVHYDTIFGETGTTDFEFYVSSVKKLKAGEIQEMSLAPLRESARAFQIKPKPQGHKANK